MGIGFSSETNPEHGGFDGARDDLVLVLVFDLEAEGVAHRGNGHLAADALVHDHLAPVVLGVEVAHHEGVGVQEELTAFEDRDAFEGLRQQAETYNAAFQKLRGDRMAFEYQVGAYWESEELLSDLRALFDYALGEIHDIRMLPLNSSLEVMWTALNARRPDRDAVRQAREAIDRTVAELDLRLPELERRAERVLGYLTRG